MKSLKTKKRACGVFITWSGRDDETKVSVIKKGTSKQLRNKVKSIKVSSGKVTLKKGKYKKGTYKLKLRFKMPAYLGYKSAVITKTFKIKIV